MLEIILFIVTLILLIGTIVIYHFYITNKVNKESEEYQSTIKKYLENEMKSIQEYVNDEVKSVSPKLPDDATFRNITVTGKLSSNENELKRTDIDDAYIKGLTINGQPTGEQIGSHEGKTSYVIYFGSHGTTRAEGDKIKDSASDMSLIKRSIFRENNDNKLRSF